MTQVCSVVNHPHAKHGQRFAQSMHLHTLADALLIAMAIAL